ncbi:uncharacterized protein HMPREF1541_05131 [Cyphellophora europaea CBS 101466]|uniref:RRM domain-containing protein n=1 Tax=Cyphellophora europaea (strain CBS 101466) TaxID=1220924 RepID=W2RWG6_CYPE1|nr:uncharacterized protein HMPREF1541_05131 [Cyphellophora europaea CBS 101466]ETN40851.1 hypothetical protein HMPREF1541_05131 [Cyphellophora europaea CBS 101466]
MNAIRQTQNLNKRELENATPPSASWHVDYRDTAWLYVGGLPTDLSEGDVCIIFSQFGNPTHLNLIRDKETGKSKGFGFLKYEDQRSCDLAVDNLGGAEVLGRLLRVDHTRYKKKDGEDEETYRIEAREKEQFGVTAEPADDTDAESDGERRKSKRRKLLKEEVQLQQLLESQVDGEEEDPMRGYLIEEKTAEVQRAKEREKDRRKHKHHHRHRRDNNESAADGNDKQHRSHRWDEEGIDGKDRRNDRSVSVERDARRRSARDRRGETWRRSRSRSSDPPEERRRKSSAEEKRRRNNKNSRSRSRSPER